MISESKLDGTFPSLQFQIYGFRTPCRLDRNVRGILLFARENLTTTILSIHSFPYDIEILVIELSFRKKKWLICCCYNYHLQELANEIQIYSNNYDDILIMSAFNAEVSETRFNSME